jgi:hypothetical protein
VYVQADAVSFLVVIMVIDLRNVREKHISSLFVSEDLPGLTCPTKILEIVALFSLKLICPVLDPVCSLGPSPVLCLGFTPCFFQFNALLAFWHVYN